MGAKSAAQSPDGLQLWNYIQPRLGDAFLAVGNARQTACNGGHRVGIGAQIDGCQHTIPVRAGMQQAPQRRLQSMKHIPVALDVVISQSHQDAGV